MSSRTIIWVGVLITLGMIILTVLLGFLQFCTPHGSCVSNFSAFMASPPNEKGDTLAGLAGSLAFLWIIITVLLQSKELSLQRQELAQTRKTMEKQTGFLEAQDINRRTGEIDLVIEKRLESLKKLFKKTDFESIDIIDRDGTLRKNHFSWMTEKSLQIDASTERYIGSFNKFYENAVSIVSAEHTIVPPSLSRWITARDLIVEILEEKEISSLAMQERINNIERIPELYSAIEKALSSKIWGSDGEGYQK